MGAVVGLGAAGLAGDVRDNAEADSAEETSPLGSRSNLAGCTLKRVAVGAVAAIHPEPGAGGVMNSRPGAAWIESGVGAGAGGA